MIGLLKKSFFQFCPNHFYMGLKLIDFFNETSRDMIFFLMSRLPLYEFFLIGFDLNTYLNNY